MRKRPSVDGKNGRGDNGQFAKGNTFGQGRPRSDLAREVREAIRAAVTPSDVREIIAALVAKAKGGDVSAANAVLDRLCGRALDAAALLALDQAEEKDVEAAEWGNLIGPGAMR